MSILSCDYIVKPGGSTTTILNIQSTKKQLHVKSNCNDAFYRHRYIYAHTFANSPIGCQAGIGAPKDSTKCKNKGCIKKEKFNIDKSSEDEIGYTQAVKVGNTIYVSGAVGWGKMEDAIKLAYQEIEKSLKNYNASFANVVKENLYTTSLDSVIKYKDLRKNYYGKDYPAATWVEVKRLYNPDLVLEVEVVAVLPEN